MLPERGWRRHSSVAYRDDSSRHSRWGSESLSGPGATSSPAKQATASADCADKPISNEAMSAEAAISDHARRYRRRGGADYRAGLRLSQARSGSPTPGCAAAVLAVVALLWQR